MCGVQPRQGEEGRSSRHRPRGPAQASPTIWQQEAGGVLVCLLCRLVNDYLYQLPKSHISAHRQILIGPQGIFKFSYYV